MCTSYTLTKKLMNISNIIQAEQGLFINSLTYLHMYSYIIVIYKYIATINEKKGAMKLKENKGEYMGAFGLEKGRREE